MVGSRAVLTLTPLWIAHVFCFVRDQSRTQNTNSGLLNFTNYKQVNFNCRSRQRRDKEAYDQLQRLPVSIKKSVLWRARIAGSYHVGGRRSGFAKPRKQGDAAHKWEQLFTKMNSRNLRIDHVRAVQGAANCSVRISDNHFCRDNQRSSVVFASISDLRTCTTSQIVVRVFR